MEARTLRRRAARGGLLAVCVVAAVVAVLELTEREASDEAAASENEPATVEPVSGTGLSRVVLSASAAERLGLETARVQNRIVTVDGRKQRGKVVPYSAVLYDERGGSWVYASPRRLTFVRAPIEVSSIRGELAVLASGPPVGTAVATVGAAELYGTEFEVDH